MYRRLCARRMRRSCSVICPDGEQCGVRESEVCISGDRAAYI